MHYVYWVGLGWIGLDWVGLGWIGLGWVGLDWVGLGWVGLGMGCAHACVCVGMCVRVSFGPPLFEIERIGQKDNWPAPI